MDYDILTDRCKTYLKCLHNKQRNLLDKELEEKGIQWIGQSGYNFNKYMAEFLISTMTSQDKEDEILLSLHKIYNDIIDKERDPNVVQSKLKDAYSGYRYVAIDPCIKDKIQHLNYEKYPRDNENNELSKISNRICQLSEQIYNMSIRMNELECNKRQPLDLFQMRNQYKTIQNEYEQLTTRQGQMISSLKVT